MSGGNDKFGLSLCTKTQVRDSHGLFDYESNQTRNLNAVLAESIFIARRKHDIKTISSLNYKLDPSYVMVTIKQKVSAIKNVSYDLMNQDLLDPQLSVKSVELSKSEVVVKGAQDTLDSIATVKALINLNNSEYKKAGTYSIDNVQLVAYDSNGHIVNNVEIVSTNISASLVLDSYSQKVPVKVLTTGELVDGKAIYTDKVELGPTEVSVLESELGLIVEKI